LGSKKYKQHQHVFTKYRESEHIDIKERLRITAQVMLAVGERSELPFVHSVEHAGYLDGSLNFGTQSNYHL
jgi:hypothetical protein